jgi:hypothetical protein
MIENGLRRCSMRHKLKKAFLAFGIAINQGGKVPAGPTPLHSPPCAPLKEEPEDRVT